MSAGTVRDIELKKRRLLKLGRGLDAKSLLPKILTYVPFLDYITRIHLDAVQRPQLAYGVYASALLGKALGLPAVSVIEFGVAGGDGLVALERHAAKVSAAFEIDIQVYGFDRGEGLFETGDVRDIVYWFTPGLFKVDTRAVESRLSKAKYIVGDIADTMARFVAMKPAPIGFMSIDVDFYTSAVDCFKLFEEAQTSRLPRVLCYLDDIFGISDLTVMGQTFGEFAAVRDWNAKHSNMPIEKVEGLSSKRAFPRYWNDQIYCLHDLSHPLYNKPVNPFV